LTQHEQKEAAAHVDLHDEPGGLHPHVANLMIGSHKIQLKKQHHKSMLQKARKIPNRHKV
jgi:hypothetical protein